MDALLLTAIVALAFGIAGILLSLEIQRNRRSIDAIIVTLNLITKYLEDDRELKQNGIR